MRFLPLLAFILVLGSVPAAGQGYVGQCSTQCDPQDPSVNPTVPATGRQPVTVILYAHKPPDGSSRAALSLDPPNAEEAGTTDVALGSGLGSAQQPFQLYAAEDLFARTATPTNPGPLAGPGAVLLLSSTRLVVYAYAAADATTPVATSKTGVVPNHRLVVALQEHWFYRPGFPDVARAEDGPVALVSRPGAPSVYEYRLPLYVEPPFLDLALGLAVGAWFEPVDQYETMGSVGGWEFHWGPRWLPRMLVPVREPLSTFDVAVQPYQGRIFVRWTVDATFGPGDVDSDSAQAVFRDREGVAVNSTPEFLGARHGAPRLVNLTWRLDPEAFHADKAPYDLELSVTNYQGTYELRHVVYIPFAQLTGTATPALETLAGLAAVGVVVALRRPRG